MPKLCKLLKSLTPEGAKKAIYIDFEGVGKSTKTKINPKPSLLGVLTGRQYKAYILDESLKPVTKGRTGFVGNGTADRILEPDLDQVVLDLVECANAEKRTILYFSDHEKSTIEEHCSPEVYEAFSEVSGNAKLLLQKWKNRRPRQREGYENTLNDFCRLAGKPKWCPKPPQVGSKKGAAAAIRRLWKECPKAKRWSMLKEEDQSLARELLAYNRQDCVVTRKLTIKAVNALAPR